jgi:hypothetical protein
MKYPEYDCCNIKTYPHNPSRRFFLRGHTDSETVVPLSRLANLELGNEPLKHLPPPTTPVTRTHGSGHLVQQLEQLIQIQGTDLLCNVGSHENIYSAMFIL